MDKQGEKLMEMLEAAHKSCCVPMGSSMEYAYKLIFMQMADYLIANGVIVPLATIGQKVYAISETRIKEAKIAEVYLHGEAMNIFVSFECDDDCEYCPFNAVYQSHFGEWECGNMYGFAELKESDFGKTVFLSREEAEKALNTPTDTPTDTPTEKGGEG